MRLHLSLLFSAALLTSCAHQGVIVEKTMQPFPMYLSHGVEGKYTFIVRDKAGALHRQMVTPDVFERYAIGQYFNDQQARTCNRPRRKQIGPIADDDGEQVATA